MYSDPDPGYEQLSAEEFSNYLSYFFSLIFMQQFDKPFKDKDNFNNLSFFNCSDLSVESKGSRTPKCCRSNRSGSYKHCCYLCIYLLEDNIDQ